MTSLTNKNNTRNHFQSVLTLIVVGFCFICVTRHRAAAQPPAEKTDEKIANIKTNISYLFIAINH